MRFDTIIIGGGLSGLMGGITLSRQGERVAIISSGKSALQFSSGSLELWGDGAEAIASIAAKSPNHPYNKIGKERIADYTAVVKDIFARAGVSLVGSSERNHLRLTPLGALKPAWLTMEEYVTFQSQEEIKGRKIAIVNIAGYLDFYPDFIASTLTSLGAECSLGEVEVAELAPLRKSATELRAINISRRLTGDCLSRFAEQVREIAQGAELVLLPAVFGIDDMAVLDTLVEKIGCPVKVAPTVSVSVGGVRAQRLLTEEFVRLGGVFIGGDTVVAANMVEGRVRSVCTANHGDQEFEAENFVIATGSFFSRGLVATAQKIYEPVAGLDVEFAPQRDDWYAAHILEEQPFQRFGVATDGLLHPTIDGRVVENMWAVGSLLAGSDAVHEGSGAGVAVMTALAAAEQIIAKNNK